jgi:hypothetical protein
VTLPNSRPALFASGAARRLAGLCGALLVLAALAVNRRVLDFGFLYLRDDDVNVALNPHMGGLSLGRLKWMFTDGSYVRRYIPLGWLNFSATYQVAGLEASAYHAVALVLYLLNCALVFALVLWALRLFRPASRPGGLTPWEVAAAALASAWWALHPFRVETTAWVSGNLYGQSTALFLAAVLAYLQTYRSQGARRASWLGLAALGYTASLLTYPIALGAPVLLVGLDWLQARADPAPRFRRLLAEKLAFFVPLAAVLAVTVAARFGNTDVYGAVPSMTDLPLWSRIAQSSYVAAYYVWKPWWPFHLSPLYDSLFEFRSTEPVFLASVAAVAAVSAWALLAFRRRPAVAVVWFGYLALAAPFFGLTEKPHMASDRYACLLGALGAVVLAAALSRVSTRAARFGTAAAALAVVAFLARLSSSQLAVWSDDRAQHAYVVRGLTNAEFRDDFISRQLILQFLRGDEQAAASEVAARLRANPERQGFRKAAAIIADKGRLSAYYGAVPYIAILQDQLALGFARAGEFREADDHFAAALRLDDRFFQAAFDRALILLRLGRSDDALQAFFVAGRWAQPPLTAVQRHEFLDRLARTADTEGRAALAAAARRARAR